MNNLENEELKQIENSHKKLVGDLIEENKRLKKENEKQNKILDILKRSVFKE